MADDVAWTKTMAPRGNREYSAKEKMMHDKATEEMMSS